MTFERSRVAAHITTGFLEYLEIDKTEVLADMVDDLVRAINPRTHVDLVFLHHYIGPAEPVLFLSTEKLLIEDEHGPMNYPTKSHPSALHLTISAAQLPVREVLTLVHAALTQPDRFGEPPEKSWHIEVEYGRYDVHSIAPETLNQILETEDPGAVSAVLADRVYVPTDYQKLKPGEVGFCYQNLKCQVFEQQKRTRRMLFSTDSLYQILPVDSESVFIFPARGSGFWFEKQIAEPWLEESWDKDWQRHPLIRFPYGKEHYRSFRVQSLTRDRFLITYRVFGNDIHDYMTGAQLLYDGRSERVLSNFDDGLEKTLWRNLLPDGPRKPREN